GASEAGGTRAGESARLAEVQRVVQQIVVRGLIDLASNDRATLAVRARTEARLERLREGLGETAGPRGPSRAPGRGAGGARRAPLPRRRDQPVARAHA